VIVQGHVARESAQERRGVEHNRRRIVAATADASRVDHLFDDVVGPVLLAQRNEDLVDNVRREFDAVHQSGVLQKYQEREFDAAPIRGGRERAVLGGDLE
jgi:ABC-type amino acid transport substrate-binding protein